MAMGMVQKARPLVEMKEKPTTASPDYETFQLLFRKADEMTSSSSACSDQFLCEDLVETDGIIEGGCNQTPFSFRPNEMHLFHTLPSRAVLAPKSFADEIRTIRVRTKRKRSRDYHLSALPISSYERWEAGIIWDDSSLNSTTRGKGGWLYQPQDDEETISKKLRKVMTSPNPEMVSGKWVNGILWDHDTTYTVDLLSEQSDDDDSNDANEETFSFFTRKSLELDDDDGDCDYGENIPLVNTTEIIDNYLPDHQEEIREIELKRKEEEEKRRQSQALNQPVAPPATLTETAAATSQPTSSAPVSQVKGPVDRAQQAREKAERVAKQRESSKNLALAAAAAGASSHEEIPLNQAAINRKKKVNASSQLEHSIPASHHLNCKVSLTANELKFYRRPLGRGLQNVWNISFDSKRNKKKLSHRRRNVRQQLANQIHTLSDLSLLDGDFICVEYIEEHPNVLMNPGMASKIINYYRQLPEEKNQNSQLNSEKAEGQSLSTTIDQTKRIPRHLQHLQQNSPSSSTASDVIDIPKLSEGITEVLEVGDPFPFLGDIEPGAPPQPCLHTNLFRAPLFTQAAHPTDFLLIRNHSDLKSRHFILRSLPIFFTCGQHEPLMIIPKPGKKKSLNDFQRNFLTLHLTRYFLNQGGTAADPVISFSDVLHEFDYFFKRYFNDAMRCLLKVADDIGDDLWRRKPLSTLPSIEEYESKFTPEEVCLHERAMCSEHQLQLLGISQINEVSKMQQGIQRMNLLRNTRKKRLNSIREAAEMCRGTAKSALLGRLADILEYHYKKLKSEIEVARFIYERMQLTPWIISESFIKGYLEKGGDGLLSLHGLGDPSGIGEGFSLLRYAKASGKQTQGPIYNTYCDIRKYKEPELDEMLAPYYTSEELRNMQRWDKTSHITFLANLAVDNGVAHELHRFARRKKPSRQLLLYEFREACQKIWKKQMIALSLQWKDIQPLGTGEEKEDDDCNSEEDDDEFDDEFSDLEEDVPSTAHGIVPSSSGGRGRGRGGRGRGEGGRGRGRGGRGSKKEAEDTKELKSIQTGEFFDSLTNNTPTSAASSSASFTSHPPQLQPSEFLVSQNGPSWKPPKQVVKRIIRKIKRDGSETIEVRFIVSDVEVRRVQAKKEANQSSNKRKDVVQAPRNDCEDLFEDARSDENALKLNIGEMKDKAQRHAHEKAQMKATQELEEQRELERYNMPVRSQKDRTNSNRSKVIRKSRLPHVLFASSLEQILVGILKRKSAILFLHPVDTNAHPDYLSIIQRPICLFDIRENIAKYKYSTVELFLEDLELMAKNCELYNGSQHFSSQYARQIYTETLELIHVDRDILGRDKDPYTIQQNDIQAKFHQLGRPLHSTITIPNLMMTSSQSSVLPNVSAPFDGFGDFLDSNKNDVRADIYLNDGLGDCDMNFDDTEILPLLSTNVGGGEAGETRSPMLLTPQALANADDDFGSSSGEEEVLEIGTF